MNKALVASLAFSFVYGLTIVFQQLVVQQQMDPLYLIFISYCLASLMLGFYLIIARPRLFPLSLAGLKWGLLTALLASITGDLFVLIGIKFSSSVNWSILSRLTVPGTFLFALLFLRQKFRSSQILSLLLTLFGAYLVVARPGTSLSLAKGDIFFFGAVLAYSLANITSEKATLTLTTFQLAALRIFTATIFFAVLLPFLPVSQSLNFGFSLYNAATLLFGTFIVTYIIKLAGGSFFSLASNLIPVFTVLISFVVLRESPAAAQLIGGLLVIVGIFVFYYPPSRITSFHLIKRPVLK